MKNKIFIQLLYFIAFLIPSTVLHSQDLERLAYNNPDILVDLGVGLWAWPLPMDYNDNGLTDLVVVCTDTPYNGIYFFENSGKIDGKTDLPFFKQAKRLGEAINNISISYIDGEPIVTTPGKWYPDFKNSAFENPENISAPDVKELLFKDVNTRANQWQFADFNGNGVLDLIVGIGVWGPREYRGNEYYGWDDAYNEKGQWKNGPLHGYIYLIENEGSNEKPKYKEPIQLLNTDGVPLNVYGRPSPNFADFNGDGKPDLICGEFRDGFTFFENVGSKTNPLFAPGRPLTNGDQIIRMDLCMITPVAYDFTGNGWLDLIVGDELRLNGGKAGRSGRRKISIVDFDGDGRLDLLLNSQNATFYKNIGEENGIIIFEDKGLLDKRKLAGHTSSPSVIDLTKDGIPELIIGAEDGYIYYRDNPYSDNSAK